MEIRTVDEWAGPLPGAEDLAGTFWRAAAEGRLLIQKCPHCGHRQHYPRHICTVCGASPDWEEASGRGTVHTFTVIRQNGSPPFRDQLPYVVAIVELDEGPRLMGNVTGIGPEDVYVGMPVVAYALKVADDIGVPSWEPADASGGR
jgi:uncharacterized OB-fold protein